MTLVWDKWKVSDNKSAVEEVLFSKCQSDNSASSLLLKQSKSLNGAAPVR